MPVASGRSGGSRQLAILAFATVAAFAAMYFLFARAGQLAGSGQIDINLGEEVFVAGQAESTADFIKDQGPWLLPDLIEGRDRDIIIQHVGDDFETGWHAFAARPAASSRDCNVKWQADDETFVDSCDGTVYDNIGTGLARYPIVVGPDGNLTVDINAADRETETDSSTDLSDDSLNEEED